MNFPKTIAIASLALAAASGCDGGRFFAVFPPPELSGLVISGSKTPLNPDFQADVFRYSVVSNAAATGISITPTAGDSMIISINGAIVPSGTDYLLDPLNPGDVVEITVQTENSGSVSYALSYLPADFPELTVEVLEPEVSPGIVYLTLRGPTANYVAAIDNNGVPVFYKKEDRAISDFKQHPNGERSYAVRTGELTSLGRVISEQVVLNSDFEEIRRLRTVGLEHTDHHEFLILPNGNSILLAYEPAVRDLTAFGGAVDGVVEDSVIQEQDMNGQVVFEWNSWGRIFYADELRGNPTDYAHINSIVVDTDDNLIVSARGVSQVSKIDKSSGVLLWTLGGKSNQFTFINDPFSHLCGQHKASRLENGHLLIFDNGQYCWPEDPARGELTRVVEYELDETNFTAELVWSYSQDGVYTLSGGSAQRLGNGNTLIGWNRDPVILATEVDADGNKVFELTANVDGESVRSYRALRFQD
jgi:hypothetical protein